MLSVAVVSHTSNVPQHDIGNGIVQAASLSLDLSLYLSIYIYLSIHRSISIYLYIHILRTIPVSKKGPLLVLADPPGK